MPGTEPNPVGHVPRPDWLGDLQKRVDEAIRQKAAAAARRGPLGISEGTWQQALHQVEINKLMDRIASGRSSIAFDRTASKEFRDARMADLRELAQTPAGFKMMSDLDASKLKTTIAPSTGEGNSGQLAMPHSYLKPDGTPGPGFGMTIKINPAVATFDWRGQTDKPWMTERPKYGLYHEMVHAWHSVHGTAARGKHQGEDNVEWQATGFGPYASASVSDNIIREQMGKEKRPGYADKFFDPAAH
jgi:NleD-like pathogen effector protein (putative zinc metallopeptidase)